MTFFVSVCQVCNSSNLKGKDEPIKYCGECGTRWIEPVKNSPQVDFLSSNVREVLYGGQAGGMKSFSLILDASAQIAKEGYNAILFRRTYKQLSGADGLIDLSHQIYPHLGGVYSQSKYMWSFKNKPGTIRFAHLEHETALSNYDGHQYAYIGFDELQTFTERMYTYLFSRNRSSNPFVKSYTRSTCNPGDIGHYWIKKRFIDPFKCDDGSYSKEKKFFTRIAGKDTQVDRSHPLAISRLFISSRLEDNPYLYRDGKGDYEKGLNQLDAVDYRRKRFGDWEVKREGRVYHQFNDSCVVSPDTVNLSQCEYYIGIDFGAVNEAFVLLAYDGNCYYLCHEEILPTGTTSDRAKRVFEILQGRELVQAFGGAKSERQQRYDYADNGLDLSEPVIPDVEAQIDRVNEAFNSGQLKIFNTMTQTITMLDNCVRDESEGIQNKASWHNLDALRYAVSGIANVVEIVSLADMW